MSIISTYLFSIFYQSIEGIMLSITIIFTLRSVILEIFLSKFIELDVKIDICLEIIMTIIFILSSTQFSLLLGLFIYICGYFLYILIKNKDIKILVETINKKRKS